MLNRANKEGGRHGDQVEKPKDEVSTQAAGAAVVAQAAQEQQEMEVNEPSSIEGEIQF